MAILFEIPAASDPAANDTFCVQEEEEREKLFKLIDINHNGMLSLAEIDKATNAAEIEDGEDP